MKCTNCGNNEANYHYRYNVNGKITEAHLCPDCAAKMEGKIGDVDFNDAFRRFDNMFEDMWRPMSLFNMPSLFDFGFGAPALIGARKEEKSAEASPEAAGSAADTELSRRREINALRAELNEAVKAENFEKAIELRDKLRELDK